MCGILIKISIVYFYNLKAKVLHKSKEPPTMQYTILITITKIDPNQAVNDEFHIHMR
jgi:hypothetical protein